MNSRKLQFNRIRFCFVFLLTGFIAISLTACGGDNQQDLKHFTNKVKERPKKGIKPLPEIKTVATFVFNPEGLRNPFKLSANQEEPVEARAYTGIKPDITRPKEELESYSLDSLRMVGTVDISQQLWGLIKAGDGTIHRVTRGNHMGRNYGKILRIITNRVELVEIVGDGPGAWRERAASIALAE